MLPEVMVIRRFLFATALAALAVAGQAEAQVRSFDDPLYRGLGVNYCGAGPRSCGEAMATAFCQANGYDQATEWAARAGIDSNTRTVRLDDNSICEGASCEAFATISCGRDQGQTFTMPVLGAGNRATVLSPNLRNTEAVLESTEYRVLIPGCAEAEPGVFMCKSILEYQHCRTLMIASLVFSCQAGLAFEGGIALPREAEAGEFDLDIESDARIRVTLGDRGWGQIRGRADVRLALEAPSEGVDSWCLQRDSYVYYPTGPEGGMAEFGDPMDCEEPIEVSFAAHEDDVVRAYDLCESFAAWGGEIEDTIELLVAGIFQIRSANPRFVATHGADGAVIAPYVIVKAPLAIDCRS